MGRRVPQSEPRKRIEPAVGDRRAEAADRPQQGRLAHPVATEEGEHLALGDAREIRIVEDPRRSGSRRCELDDLKHGRRPCRGNGLNTLVAPHLVGRARRDDLPVVHAETRSASPSASDMSCSISRNGRVRGRASSDLPEQAPLDESRGRPPGSSSSSSRGSPTSAIATSSWRCSPCDRSRDPAVGRGPGGRRARAPREPPGPHPVRAIRPQNRQRARPRAWLASRTFSRTVRPTKRLETWNVRARPSPARPAGRPPRDVPAKQVDTAAGRPHLAGDEPEQRGLARAVRSDDRDPLARAQGQRDPVDGDDTAEAAADSVEGESGRARSIIGWLLLAGVVAAEDRVGEERVLALGPELADVRDRLVDDVPVVAVVAGLDVLAVDPADDVVVSSNEIGP